MMVLTENPVLNAMLVWLIWGFVMSIGWALGGWLMSKVLR